MSEHLPAWIAGPDGIAHANYPHPDRTLCGAEPIAPRYAWPTLTRCPACEAATTGPTFDPHPSRNGTRRAAAPSPLRSRNVEMPS
jgi:hypothetical protein